MLPILYIKTSAYSFQIETLDYHKIDAFDPSKYLVDNLIA